MAELMAKQVGLKASGISTGFVSDFLSGDLAFLNSENYVVMPGFCDVHVHFREPGFSYKETIATGSLAAAHGGYTAVCTMPNLNPVPDSAETLAEQLRLIDGGATIKVLPYGAITVEQKGERLSNMQAMANNIIAFSDDGRGIQSADLMQEAMLKAKDLGKIIVAHCEDNLLLFGGYIHKGEYAAAHNHKGICSESEWKPIERDLNLAAKTGAAYHVCHISCKESVELIRQAKKSGVNVTCETAPHYLVLNDSNLQEHGRFKMNPPLRSYSDMQALLEGVTDGTIDMIATDHAPHSCEEKSKGLSGSAFGVVGLETAFAVMNTHLVKKGVITLEKLVELMSLNPRRRFNIKLNNEFTVWNTQKQFLVQPDKFLSKGRATPFENEWLYGVNMLTVYGNKAVYKNITEE